MKSCLFFLFILLNSAKALALEYSKIEHEGCPENSFCKKETGLNRKEWLLQLKLFSKGMLSEQKINSFIQSQYGLPINGWAQEEGSLLPNILMWDSPCKQHSKSINKYYIADIFRKNLNSDELISMPHLFLSRAILLDSKNIPYSVVVPRGDAPLYMKDGSLYYLREEDGIFYGLLIDKKGILKITKSELSPEPSKEANCKEDQISLFNRESPNPNFYQGTYCKEIWDKTSKTYKTILLGWSCN
jgi:hypothetical protein